MQRDRERGRREKTGDDGTKSNEKRVKGKRRNLKVEQVSKVK